MSSRGNTLGGLEPESAGGGEATDGRAGARGHENVGRGHPGDRTGKAGKALASLPRSAQGTAVEGARLIGVQQSGL